MPISGIARAAREKLSLLPHPSVARPALLALAVILLAIPRSTSHLGTRPTKGLGAWSPVAPAALRVLEVSEWQWRLHQLRGGLGGAMGEADEGGVGRSAEVLTREQTSQLHKLWIICP